MNQTKSLPLLAIVTRAVACVVVLIVGGLIVAFLTATAPTVAKVTQEIQPPQVMVFRAAQAEVRRQWRGFGVASAIESADVPSRVTAVVIERPAEVQAGRPVKVNALLARLDPTDFQKQVDLATQRIAELDAQLTQLEVEEKRVGERMTVEDQDVALAQSEVTRLEKLLKDRAAEQREVDQAKRVLITSQRALLLTKEAADKFEARKAAWRALKAGQETQLSQAKLNVARCEIKSPIDGILQTVDVELGENITAGQRVARVVSLGKIEVAVQLPTAARADVVLGGEVLLTPANGTALSWKAKVARVSPEVDASARTLVTYVEVDQTESAYRFGTTAGAGLLTPGSYVNAVAFATTSEQRWVVPRRSVRSDRILLASAGMIRSQPMRSDYVLEGKLTQFGLPDDQWVVLETGDPPLREGELIVVNASITARDGDRVQPMLPDGKPAPLLSEPVKSPEVKDAEKNGKAATDKASSRGADAARRHAS